MLLDGYDGENFMACLKHLPVIGEMFYCRGSPNLGFFMIVDIVKIDDTIYEIKHFNLKTKKLVPGWKVLIISAHGEGIGKPKYSFLPLEEQL